jgi:alkyl sulfatase BDS1-like metallo-beta-lactamase superfamily hydrolase
MILLFRRLTGITAISMTLGCCVAANAQIAPKAAEPATIAANAELAKTLPFADRRDFDDAMRGFIGTVPDALIAGSGPRPVWSMKPYEFEKQDTPPDSVNPSLWRQAQLDAIHGLFEVTEHVYQVRGFDISNMTIVEGDTSLIIVDTLATAETARAALELYYQHRPRKSVSTVIFTHNHSDHYGGIKGVTTEADVAAGKVQIVAPTGFMEALVGDSITAGVAMNRRAQFQFGIFLPPGPRGQVDTGLGKAIALGRTTLIAPTSSIDKPMETRTIDGVEIVFTCAGIRSAGRNAAALPAIPRPRHGRGRHPHHAQSVHHPRLGGARRQSVVTLYQ